MDSCLVWFWGTNHVKGICTSHLKGVLQMYHLTVAGLTTSTILEDGFGFPSLGQSILCREFVLQCTPESTEVLADKKTRNFPSGLKRKESVKSYRVTLEHKFICSTCLLSWVSTKYALCRFARPSYQSRGWIYHASSIFMILQRANLNRLKWWLKSTNQYVGDLGNRSLSKFLVKWYW